MASRKKDETQVAIKFYFNEDLKGALNTQKIKRHIAKSLLQEIFYFMENCKALYKKKDVIDAIIGVAGNRLPCERILKEIVSRQIEFSETTDPKRLFLITTDECKVYSSQNALNVNPDITAEFVLLSPLAELRIHWGRNTRTIPLTANKKGIYKKFESLRPPHKKLFYQLVKQGCSILNAWTFMKEVSGYNASYNSYRRWYLKVDASEKLKQDLNLDKLYEVTRFGDGSFVLYFREYSTYKPIFYLKEPENKCTYLLYTQIDYGLEDDLAKLIKSPDFSGYALNESNTKMQHSELPLAFDVKYKRVIRFSCNSSE